jgi:tetratricopeptide (TPR) repeat protein
MGDRAVDCARLESVCAERHQGFESPPIRQPKFPAGKSRPQLLAGLGELGNNLSMRFYLALIIFATSSLFGAGNENPPVGENLLKVARRDFANEDFTAAHAALDRFEKLKGRTAESYDLRGCIYIEQQNFGGAAKAFEAAHGAEPKLFAPRLHAGDLLLRQKRYAEARGVYETLLRETNILTSSEALRFGILISFLGEHDENGARRALDKITFPTESPAYYYAQAAWAFAHGKPSEAKKWIKRASEIFDSATTAWFARPLYDFGWIKKRPPIALPESA